MTAGRVAGKRVLVTGGASGLGAAIVRRLAGEGARVFVADIDAERGTALAADTGGRFLELDVTDEAAWIATIAAIEQDAGGLDGLVNNAAIINSRHGLDIETIAIDDLHRLFAVNVDGTVLGCKHAIPLLARSGGGSIVNMSSIAALLPAGLLISYSASKATVMHITRSVALHCAEKGHAIRCNTVHPGNILTPMLRDLIARTAVDAGMSYDEMEAHNLSRIPLGKFQEESDIAHAVLYLISDEARYITGSKLVIDGGMTLSN